MGLETVTHISDLVVTNPTSADPKSEGDDHLRGIKTALKTDFPNITAPVTATAADLNKNTGGLNTKIVDIGDWNMSTTAILNTVAHGLTLSKIRTVTVLIRNDPDNNYTDFLADANSGTGDHYIAIDSTNITLSRADFFNDGNYVATSYNRGWVTIQYTD